MSKRKRILGALLATALLPLALASTSAADNVPIYNEPHHDGGPLVTETFQIGPINLAASGNPGSEASGLPGIPRPDSGPDADYIALRGIEFDLVDEHGTSMANDEVHFHHLAFITWGAHDPACPSRGFGKLHLASGAERTPIGLPEPYAMKVPDSEGWVGNYHVMNHTDEAVEVYLEYTITHQPGRTDANTRWVEPWFLDVSGHCGDAEYDVPGDGGPDSVHVQSKSWEMPGDGILLGTGGHLHDGGIATELRDSDDTLICRSEVTYAEDDDHEHHHSVGGSTRSSHDHHAHGSRIERIDPCPLHWAFEEGEVLTLDAIYENHQPVPGAMGINVVFIWWGNQNDGVAEFPDVPGTHPFHTAISWGIDRGITEGFPDGDFKPARTTTRQALMAFLHRMAGAPDGPFHAHFTDVPMDHPFHDEIAWAADAGIAQGWPDGTFRPGQEVSRQAAVAFLHRIVNEDDGHEHHHSASTHDHGDHGDHEEYSFTDVPMSHPFHDEILWASMNGIVEGWPDGTFRPTHPVTRQAAMAFLARTALHLQIADYVQQYADWFDWYPLEHQH
jgi:hypothetical protein